MAYRLRTILSPQDDRGLPHFYEEVPININYITDTAIGLQKRYEKYFALRVKCVYCQTLDIDTLERIEPIHIVEERYTYTWGEDGLPLSQGKEIRFLKDDGSINLEPDKILPGKALESGDREKIIVARRNDIIDYLKARSKELGLVGSEGENLVESFFDYYFEDAEKYIRSGKPDLIGFVNNSQLSWFDIDISSVTPFASVRQAIAYNLQKALEVPTEKEINQFLSFL